MKLCFVNINFKGRGGAERIIIQLANLLQKEGHSVSLIDFSGENKFEYKVEAGVKKAPVIGKRKTKRKIMSRLLQLRNKLTAKKIAPYDLYKEQTDDLIDHLNEEKYDAVILCQSALTSLLPEIKKRTTDIQFVVWEHGEYERYIQELNRGFVEDFKAGVEKADQVICLTERDAKKYRKLNKNTRFIYNPLTIKNEKSLIASLQNKKIVFVGNLFIHKKGLDYLIELAKTIRPAWKIVIAGDGPDRRKFEECIQEAQLQDRILLKGKLGDDELSELYAEGSIFISTSRSEGFGLVLTEAMSFGLPVVSFKTNGPEEILDQGNYGILVDKGDLRDYSHQLNKLMDHVSERKKYQKKSLRRIEYFKEEKILKEWKNMLEELLTS